MPFYIKDEYAYERMPAGEDQVRSALQIVSNTLDHASFADAAINMTAASKLKMSIGATSAVPPTDEYNDLFKDERPW